MKKSVPPTPFNKVKKRRFCIEFFSNAAYPSIVAELEKFYDCYDLFSVSLYAKEQGVCGGVVYKLNILWSFKPITGQELESNLTAWTSAWTGVTVITYLLTCTSLLFR